MLKKENLKSYIDELIKEIEEELDESTATGAVDGYQTPFAFSGKRKQDKEKADSNIEVTGYTKVKDIDEVNEATSSEIIKDLDKVKNDLLKKVDVLVAKKKKLYSDVDIESPMSADEKKLDKEIADLFSQINQLVLQKRKIKESVNEGKSKRPVNRWLELKNDESMHANKKLAVGLKELKHQLSEVEKFFRWYNQIKTMNELSSDVFWKRTHGHIYKIKERLINIAKTIQEIEK